MQWLVFKTYLKQVNWWIWFPLIIGYISALEILPFALLLWFAFRKHLTNIQRFLYYLLTIKGLSLIIYTLVIRELLFNSKNQLLINFSIIINHIEFWLAYGGLIDALGFWYSWITATLVFNAIQAIAICYLHKRKRDTILYIDSKSLFAITTDLKNYWQIRSIINKLENKINRIWKEELNTRFTLTYWLAVKDNSEIVACYPLNQVSQDNFTATPLSQLICEQIQTAVTNTVKLQVTFDYPGTAKIKSLAGIPLSSITICFLSIITIFSLPIAYAILPLILRLF